MNMSSRFSVWHRRFFIALIVFCLLSLPYLNSSLVSASSQLPAVTAEMKAKITGGDYDALLAKANVKPVRLIVTLDVADYGDEIKLTAEKAKSQRAKIKEVQGHVLSGIAGQNFQLIAAYDVFPIIAVEADALTLQTLTISKNVKHIKEDIPEAPVDFSSNNVIGLSTAFSLGYTGTGWTVVVLDTGAQRTHPFLTGRIVSEACFSTTSSANGSTTVCPNGRSTSGSTPGMTGTGAGNNCSLTIYGCNHGTHVTGTAAGRNYSGGPGYDGVAKNANIISIQVFSRFSGSTNCGSAPSPCALAYNSDTIAALQYVYTTLRPVYKIAAINMSLGGGRYTSYCDTDPRKPAIDNLRASGIATVIAAGNSGYTNALGAPACISSAISVGSTTDSDSISYFSNRAWFLSLFAPGSSIDSSVPNSTFANMQGTSMAAPHVAGAWALMKQRNPNATVSQILSAFRSTGRLVYINSTTAIPRIRLGNAIQTLAAGTASSTATTSDSEFVAPGQ